jgi:hypothetical protein
VLNCAPPDERPELISGDPGVRQLAGAEEGTEACRVETLGGVLSLGSVARFVGTVSYHADILCASPVAVNTKSRQLSSSCLPFVS